MSIHVCKCEHNGRTEYHLRYPGMTHGEAQALADSINGGELVGAGHPLRKDAERYRWLRDVASGGDWEHIGQNTDPASTDARIDECMAAYKAVGAA